MEVDGLLPRLTARHILAAAAALAKGMKPEQFHGWSPSEMVEAISSESLGRRIYLVIHNIDGPRCQDTGAQRTLSELAALLACLPLSLYILRSGKPRMSLLSSSLRLKCVPPSRCSERGEPFHSNE